MARLKVLEGYHNGKSFPLTDEVILGRDPEDGICLPDGRVSRQHARVRRRRSGFVIEDLDSANGVILRGERLPPHPPCVLHDGDEIRICSTRFVFRADAPKPAQQRSRQGNTRHADMARTARKGLSVAGEFGTLSFTPLGADAPQPKVAVTFDAATSMIAVGIDEQQTDTGLQEALKRLQAICQVSIALGTTADREVLLQKLLAYILEIFPAADRASIMLWDLDRDALEPVAVQKRQETPGQLEEVAISQTIVHEVVTHKRSLLSFDAMDDGRFHGHTSVVDLSIQSMMCVPLLVGDEVLGLVQVDTSIGPQLFTPKDLQVLTDIGAQAAIAVKNFQLVEDFKRLFDALIELLATAIDEKSPCMGGHGRRVPILTMMLAEAACQTTQGPLRDFRLSKEELYELKVVTLLHDYGKVITPVHIVDKATKLEGIFDRVGLLDTRFEVLKRDAEIVFLRKELALRGNGQASDAAATEELRKYLQYHVAATIKMLEAFQYPTYLRRVPLLVGVHHERMDGKGYPKGLTGEHIPVPGRVLALADIFEALTAQDRPYKPGKTLSEALRILGLMKQEGHIDPHLFDVCINEQVYLRYAKAYLSPEQLDEVVLTEIPGYAPPQ